MTTCFHFDIVKRSENARNRTRLPYAANTQVPESEEMAFEGRKTPVFTYKKFLARTGKAAWTYVQRSLGRTALGSMVVLP